MRRQDAFFLGAAEEVTADGLEPAAIRGGTFVDVQPGGYTLFVSRIGTSLTVSFHPISDSATNSFTKSVRV